MRGSLIKQTTFKVELIDTRVDPGTAPYFKSGLKITKINCEKTSKIILPAIEDDEDDFDSLKVNLQSASKFLSFSKAEKAFSYLENAANVSDVGLYEIKLELKDK